MLIRAFATNIGRGMLTFGLIHFSASSAVAAHEKDPAAALNISQSAASLAATLEKLPLSFTSLSGRVAPLDSIIALDTSSTPPDLTVWPDFHVWTIITFYYIVQYIYMKRDRERELIVFFMPLLL
jgi:hypothetical protein